MTADHHVVRLRRVPPLLFVEHRRHLDDLVHELQIVQVGRMQGQEVAPALARALGEFLERYAVPRDALFKQARAAAVRGEPIVDLETTLPAEAAVTVDTMIELLEEADALARAGLVLTLPASDEISRFRRWAVSEIRRQAAGEPPIPYEPDAAGSGPSGS